MTYDPDKHHRHSIRLKGFDYTHGTFFITICAHGAAGNIFAHPAARAIVARQWEGLPARFQRGAPIKGAHPDPEERAPIMGAHTVRAPLVGALPPAPLVGALPCAIMPDHFHGLLRLAPGNGASPAPALGDIIGAFKSLVVRDYSAAVRSGELPPFPGHIWHRNYYECIVRSETALRNIVRYIRDNPWRIPIQLGPAPASIPGAGRLRGIGNPHLLERHKTGLLASRRCPDSAVAAAHRRFAELASDSSATVISGFHAPLEHDALPTLLAGRAALIVCLPHAIEPWRVPEPWLPALEANRMLILSLTHNRVTDRAAALARNALVLRFAQDLYVPYATPGGGLAAQLNQHRSAQGIMP